MVKNHNNKIIIYSGQTADKFIIIILIMADYWKSLPKKYCDFCKCWITDNKASRDFHERGFRHQANVRRRVHDIQKNSSIQERERQKYQNEMLKIEAAALKSFKANDVSRDSSLTSEFATTKSIASQIIRPSTESKVITTNRFGEDFDNVESETLANGKRRALETIAKSFEKKSKWLEAKTSDGESYYWNKETMETRKDPPKSGFLTILEQEQFKMATQQAGPSTKDDNNDDVRPGVYRIDPYGGWRTVDKYDTSKMVDLQLPGQNVAQIVADIEQTKQEEERESRIGKRPAFEFEERTVESLDTKKLKQSTTNDKTINIGFKQRKQRPLHRQNIRNRTNLDN
ncbi:uncharacterized protein LOC124493529 [Dermatophagoides farinae]|uniref:uncharacterized protein LOC124493529 n=1 Tax=Dermatophagoides farinae TaxID=6954 RepID=UPI003F5EDA93